MKKNKGYTLLDVLIAMAISALVIASVIYFALFISKRLYRDTANTQIEFTLSSAVEIIDKQITDGIAITVNQGIVEIDTTPIPHIFFLYNKNDINNFDDQYSEETYQLRKVVTDDKQKYIQESIVIAESLVPPPATYFSFKNNLVTIQLVGYQNDEKVTYNITRSIKP
ncbi:PilW family protein [Candidatus Margulisiibacteriota bacterium]